MARSKRLRERHRTAIAGSGAEQRAEIILPMDAIEPADPGQPVRWGDVVGLLASVTTYPAELALASSSVALVLDDFAFDVYFGDRFTATGTHDGPTFRELAVSRGVDVVVAAEIDVRRTSATDLAAAAAAGRLAGARVTAFGVQTLESR